MKAYYTILVFLFLLLPVSCVLEGGPAGQAGGYVFYDKGDYSDGWRYLECAPEDASADQYDGDDYRMGSSTAHTLCEDYRYGGYDDWYLPSIEELKWMYRNLYENGMGNFVADEDSSFFYWSSSISEIYTSTYGTTYYYYYVFDFKEGIVKSSTSGDYYVRPVRKF
jgi:hypothetical protein